MSMVSCTSRNSEHFIQDVHVSNYVIHGEVFSMDVETILNEDIKEEFYYFNRGDLSFNYQGSEDPSSVIYQVKDKDGKILGSGSKDGPGIKEIIIPYRNIPITGNGLYLVVTLTKYGRKIDKKIVPLELSQESLSSIE